MPYPGPKQTLNQHKRTESHRVCYQPQNNQTKSQYQKNNRKISKPLEAKHTLLNYPWVKQDISRRIFLMELNENENITSKSVGYSQSSAKNEMHSTKCLHQINNLSSHLKKLKKEQHKPKANRRKKIIKIKCKLK